MLVANGFSAGALDQISQFLHTGKCRSCATSPVPLDMATSPKIKSLEELASALDDLRAESPRRVVHCHGVFDLLHIGHIRYLQKARALGDLLVVTLTPDQFVNKGTHRPAFNEQLRLDALAALDCVDFVALNDGPTATEVIRRLKPDSYVKGAEFRDRKTPELLAEEKAAAEVGATLEFIEDVTSSSSHLINKYLSPFSDDVDRYLSEFRQRHTAADVLGWLERAAEMKVLVVGEAIIDEYYTCSTMGQSAKAPIIATRYESHERFAGGALAVANHLAPFCGSIDLVAMLGDENGEEDWIRSQLRGEVSPRFHYKQSSPTIIKRRYRESYFAVPLFAINFLNDEPPAETEESQLCSLLEDSLDKYDVVIVADYGHQMLTGRSRQLLCDKARFLAVNTQTNAANAGFHAISKYSRADYVSLADHELKLECRSRGGDLQELLMEVGKRLYATTIAVTLGSRGCLCYNRRGGFHEAPALATNVVDRIGAGDTFLAISSLCAALDAPLDVLAFLGNVAGAEAVAVVGNSQSLEATPFERHVESLFK
jgi:rfaE bifunctional protein nucleotidyltransferase chain/domain